MRSFAAGVVIFVSAAACTAQSDGPTTSSSTPAAGPISSSTTSMATGTPVEPMTTWADGSDPGEILVIGDWGSGRLPQGAVSGAMARYADGMDIAAIVTTGDNFYSDDAEFLMEPLDWAISEGIPFWIAWGNHDVESKSRVEAVDATFSHPKRWIKHTWGALDIIILDSNRVDSSEQLEFLEEAVDSSERGTIVVFHHPPFNCGSHNAKEKIQESWLSRFDDDVFLVLSGHDHNYQRFEKEGVTYVVSGGGGAGLYEIDSCPRGHPQLLAGVTSHHFLVLDQTGSQLTLEVIDVNGEPLDAVVLTLPVH